MRLYITEISRYVITLLMLLYTLECFLVFRFDNEDDRYYGYIRQNIYMFFLHFLTFLTLTLTSGQIEYLFFYAFLQILVFTTIVLFRTIYPTINKLTVNNMCMLLSVGFIILSRLDFSKATKQFIIVAISMVVVLLIPKVIDTSKKLRDLTYVYAIVGIVALGIVLLLGSVTLGSKISYSLLGVTFQPSEFVKVLYIFFLAALFKNRHSIPAIGIGAIGAAIHVIILVLSRDLGSALIFFVCFIIMVFVASGNYWYLLIGTLGGSASSFFAYRLFPHVQSRVLAWQDPWKVIDNQGYQITQSIFAISNGGLLGAGLNRGNPKAIPFVETDFIFSAICEELGLLFAICVILICISSFIMFMLLGLELKDKFYRLVSVGLGSMYIFQIFLTVGGGTKLIPLTGVTLPLISYGGSSILTTLVAYAIVQGLHLILSREDYIDDSLDERMDDEYNIGSGWSIEEE